MKVGKGTLVVAGLGALALVVYSAREARRRRRLAEPAYDAVTWAPSSPDYIEREDAPWWDRWLGKVGL